jgi:hypothetical protein
VLIIPALQNGKPVWSWLHRNMTGSHPRDDTPDAATTVAAVLRADPP